MRALAFRLGVSPATVSEAWSELRRQKMIAGRGRTGTWVCGDRSRRVRPAWAASGTSAKGCSTCPWPCPIELLPPLGEALRHGAGRESQQLPARAILAELRAAVEPRWPYRPETFLATNGGYNAVYAMLHALVMPGASIAIEDPTAMRLLDIIEDLGAEILPGRMRCRGAAARLPRKGVAEEPHGLHVSAPHPFRDRPRGEPARSGGTRRDVWRQRLPLLSRMTAWAMCLRCRRGLGDQFPERVIHILSFSKSLGPDLRLAVLSSSTRIVEQIQSYRSFSSGWTSRALQSAVAWLLHDEETGKSMVQARTIYKQRRDGLMRALGERNVHLSGGDGLVLWIPVASEQFALVTLAARGIAVLAGEKCSVRPINYIRVATSILRERQEEVADAIALAVRSPDQRF